MIKICPQCNQRYSVQPYDIDFVHECNSQNETLDKEDVLRLGNYVNDAGSTVIVTNTLRQGEGNKLIGTRAWIEGDDPPKELTSRGANKETHFTRQRNTYIDLKEE